MNEKARSKAFDKLMPERKALMEQVLKNLEKGDACGCRVGETTAFPSRL